MLVRLERTGPAPSPELRRLIRGAFAHRRKALPRSLELAGGIGGPDVRPRARAALEAIGHPPDERAERLAPRGVPRAAGAAAGVSALGELAPAKVNLGLTLGPTRADGRHELVTVMQPVDLCDRVRLLPTELGATSDEVHCPGVEGDNLAAAALRAFRERTGWTGAPVRLEIVKRIPVAAGMAGGSADAAAALRLAARAAGCARRRRAA